MSNNMYNYRADIINSIIPYSKMDQRITLLVCDMGFGVTDKFNDEFPDRIFNMGLAEQGTVGIAAGLAMTGLVPIVYSIVNFLVFRTLEQIRNDVVMQGLNVKFIGTGANDYFQFLGPSHCCGQDDIRILEMIGLEVYDPYEKPDDDFGDLVHRWIQAPGPGYLRV